MLHSWLWIVNVNPKLPTPHDWKARKCMHVFARAAHAGTRGRARGCGGRWIDGFDGRRDRRRRGGASASGRRDRRRRRRRLVRPLVLVVLVVVSRGGDDETNDDGPGTTRARARARDERGTRAVAPESTRGVVDGGVVRVDVRGSAATTTSTRRRRADATSEVEWDGKTAAGSRLEYAGVEARGELRWPIPLHALAEVNPDLKALLEVTRTSGRGGGAGKSPIG